MLEAGITVGVAVVGVLSAVSPRLHNRIHELDRRVDNVELRIAENYISKQEFSISLERVESHMIRIENKLDKLIQS